MSSVLSEVGDITRISLSTHSTTRGQAVTWVLCDCEKKALPPIDVGVGTSGSLKMLSQGPLPTCLMSSSLLSPPNILGGLPSIHSDLSPLPVKSQTGEELTVTFHHGDVPTSSNLVPEKRNVAWKEREREGKSIIYARSNIDCSLFTPKFKCILIVVKGPLPEPHVLSREGISMLLYHHHQNSQ